MKYLLLVLLSLSAFAQDDFYEEDYDERMQDELEYLEEASESADYYLPEREEVAEIHNPEIIELEEEFMNDEINTSAAAPERTEELSE